MIGRFPLAEAAQPGDRQATSELQLINHNPFPNAPDYNINVNARYDLPLGGGASRLFLAGDINVQGKTDFVLYRSVEYSAEGNYELGAKLGYAAAMWRRACRPTFPII